MTEAKWKSFLQEYNRELLSYEEVVEQLPKELLKAAWLGYAGATEREIARVEKRLTVHLPPSYRAFLKTSNGWRFPSVSIFNLFPVEKLDWFKKLNGDWVDTYVRSSADLPEISDDEYFDYGDSQNTVNFRTEYLESALQISEEGDSSVVLLNPKIVTPEGEWETWFFANWLPGAVRYRSFGEWLAAERVFCSKQLKTLPKKKVKAYITAKKPVSAQKAQSAARSGDIGVALESLESFATKGDDSAAASLAEIYAFQGEWDRAITNAGRLIANPGAVRAGNVFNDMINLLGRAGHCSGQWSHVIEVVKTAMNANAIQSGNKNLEAFRNRNDKVFRNLIEYAKRKGGAPHELLAIFGVQHPEANIPLEERRKRYEDVVQNVDSILPHLKKDPQARMEYFFSYAKGSLEDEALKLYEEHGSTFIMAWSAAEYAAGVYVKRGKMDAAWAALAPNIGKWLPVDIAQVAPVVLLTDEHLHKLMTPERCQLVLATPRGPEAFKKGMH